ncbi:hypothetical protein [Marinospirillum perlucidum]|uniref:hypothetical protein n=1 Tax=Marinospirillum perlucidum TaxID=1982602 RepID=UPI000DF469C7|nr:hypothetical protein [Marinospirillum perlucidum]
MLSKTFKMGLLALSLAGMTACATQGTDSSSTDAVQLFEYHADDGRIYVFDDVARYQAAVMGNKPPYHLNRIGAGPDGQTLVFGLSKDQAKQREIDFIQVYDGSADYDGDFYGQLQRDHRIYIADSLEEFHSARTGEPTYHVNRIAEGPEGETLVFIQNGDNKGTPADALIQQYQTLNAQ